MKVGLLDKASFRFIWLCLLLVLIIGFAPRAMAQTDSLTVLISQIKSDRFPTVDAYVTVADVSGAASFGLTTADFQVLEANQRVDAASILVESDNSQALSLVLALDVSMPQEPLTIMQVAVNGFIDTLGAQDQVAVVALYDEVVEVQGFTSEKNLLKRAVDSLVPEGNRTALNEAVFQATSMVSTLPPSRKGVLLFTNSADNVSTRSFAETLDKAQALGVPVFPFGFSARVETSALQQMASLTGGQPFILEDASELAANLSSLSLTLRQGYKISFQSSLQADNAEHPLIIQVDAPAGSDEAAGRFSAIARPVTVTLPDLADEQTLGGLVTISPLSETPAPIATVEYLLDGETLTTLSAAPFDFDWDSGRVTPGLYNLTVRVVDAVGNEGKLERKVKVVPAIKIEVKTDKPQAEIGEKIAVEAEVEAINEIVSVDFLVDGKVVQSDTRAPYQVSLDSNDWRVGNLKLTALATDLLGQSAEAETDFSLVALPTPVEPEVKAAPSTGFASVWQRLSQQALYLLTGIGLVLGLLVAVGAMLLRLQNKETRYRLRIENQGNARSRFILRAVEATNNLEFKFAINGQNLPHRNLALATANSAAMPPGLNGNGASAPDLDFGDTSDLQWEDSANPPQQSGNFLDKAVGVAETGGVIGEILYLIGALLPRALRTPIQQIGSRIRRGRSAVRRIQRVSDRATDKKSVPPPSDLQAMSQPLTQAWAQTPYINPGHTQIIDLVVRSTSFFQRKRQYSFEVLSKSVEIESAPLVVEQGTVILKGMPILSQLMRLMFISVIVVTMAALCIGAYFLVSTVQVA